MLDRRAMAPYDALFTGHDAGYWNLPDEVIRARKALSTLDARRAAVRAEMADLEPMKVTAEAAVAVADLAGAGKRLPEQVGSALVVADDRRRALAFDDQALESARTIVAQRLVVVLRDATDRMVRDALRPAFVEIVATARSLAPALAGVNLQSGGWSASEAERRARESLRDLMPRWLAILDAHARLLGIDRESRWYSPVRSIDAVYPKRTMIAGRIPPPPWPTDPAERLLWWVSSEGVELWLPTLAEEREAYEAAEEARPKVPAFRRPTIARPRSPERPVLRIPGASSGGNLRIQSEAPPE
jgi:hypothetical protein